DARDEGRGPAHAGRQLNALRQTPRRLRRKPAADQGDDACAGRGAAAILGRNWHNIPRGRGVTMQERCEAFAATFPRNRAAWPYVGQEQGRDVAYGTWVIGNDYRN